MNSLVLARKWRPRDFNTVTGQNHVVQTLTQALNLQRLHHAYLFTGTRGVGKTSIARIFAKALSCETGITSKPCGQCLNCREIDSGCFADLIEIDAASRSKVEDTREILDNIFYPPVRGRFKIYLIDEIHMLSNHSFNALLKTLEEPPEHVKFLLATTDPKKLPITVLSRCLQFHLKNMLPSEIISHLEYILRQENITYESSALPWIAQAADGSMRDALSLLDQAIAYGQNALQEKNVCDMLGYVEIHYISELFEALIARDASKLISLSRHLQHQGADFAHILGELAKLFHQLTLFQAVSGYTPDYFSNKISQWATQISPEDLQLFYQIALKGLQDLDLAPTAWVGFEMTLIRMLTFQWVETETTSIVDSNHQNNTNKPQNFSPSQVTPNNISSSSTSLSAHALPEMSIQNITWEKLLSELNVSGMVNNVAQYCVLLSFSGNKMILGISTKHTTLLTVSMKTQLEIAICDYFSQKFKQHITIAFQVAEEKLNAPATVKAEKKQTELENAQIAFNQDPKLNKILETFRGTIVPDSIELFNNEVT